MKTPLKLASAALFLCVMLTMSVSAVGTYWTFDDPEATIAWGDSSTNNAEVSQEDGAMVITITGEDPYLAHNLTEEEQFDAAAFPFVKVRYKTINAVTVTSEFFWGTDLNPGPAGNTNKQFDLSGDEEWTEYVVNISDIATWAGKVSVFRFDPLQGTVFGDETVYVDYIAFFATEEEALAWTEPTAGAAEPVEEEPAPAPTETEAPDAVAEPAETDAAVDAAPEQTTAPATFDPITLTAAAAAVSAAAVAVCRKKR